MTEEIEDDINELELEDDALEKKMKKLEDEVSRLLNHSNELLQAVDKERAKLKEGEEKEPPPSEQ
jgi:predicted nuclease with TOPRIM domain